MSFVAAAVIGGALITGKSNKDATKAAANATPKFNTTLQQPIENQLGRVADTQINTFGGDRVADLTANQTGGISMAQALAGTMQGQADTTAAGFDTFASGANVGNNPHLEAAIQAMRQSSLQDVMRNQLPGVRNNAVAAGGVGGSRQGIAEGLVLSDLNQQLINRESGMRTNQFNTDLAQQLQALTNQGAILSGQGNAQEQLLRTGALEQGQNQAEINAGMDRFNEDQNLQFNRDKELLALLMGTGQATTPIPSQTNPLVAGLGAGITTSQLFGQQPAPLPVFNPGPGTAGFNPASTAPQLITG